MKSRYQLPSKIFHRKGFTLIEMMVVLAIIGTLSTVVLSRYPDSAEKTRLSNMTGDLGSDIREAQLKASSVSTYGQAYAGFGMQFASNSSQMYKEYADKITTNQRNGIFLGNRLYDGVTENFKTVTLPEGFHIDNTCVSSTTISRPFSFCSKNGDFTDLSIEYERPNPEPWIFVNNSTSTLYAASCVELVSNKIDEASHKNGYSRSVLVTKTGLISTLLGRCTQVGPLTLLPTSGVCSTLHYSCVTGNSSSPLSGVNTWTWQCSGQNGGGTSSCTENKSNSQTFPISGFSGVNPSDIAVDSLGNMYTSNFGPSDVAKISPAGLGVFFSNVGPLPKGIVLDEARSSLYTADYGAPGSISKVDMSTGVAVTPFYLTGGRPVAIDVDSFGNIYVALFSQSKVLKVSPAGVLVAQFSVGTNPNDIAIDTADNVYTANFGNNTVSKIDASGLVTINFASTGVTPYAIATDVFNNVFTANTSKDSVTKINSSGIVTLNFGGSTGASPAAIATDSSGNVFTANQNSSTVTKISTAGIVTVNYGTTGNSPESITVDNFGNVYTANNGSNNVTKILVH